jgi:hypothetical protein
MRARTKTIVLFTENRDGRPNDVDVERFETGVVTLVPGAVIRSWYEGKLTTYLVSQVLTEYKVDLWEGESTIITHITVHLTRKA